MACKFSPKTSQTTHENYTRFFVLSTKDAKPTGKDKTRIIFSAKHEPGSLYHALGEFAKRNINLTRIESRPTRKTAWEYNFYLDFEGHRTQPQCSEALKALEKYAIFVKILGSYPKVTSKIFCSFLWAKLKRILLICQAIP